MAISDIKRLERAGEEKSAAQTGGYGFKFGESCPQGCDRKKALKPAKKRELVDFSRCWRRVFEAPARRFVSAGFYSGTIKRELYTVARFLLN